MADDKVIDRLRKLLALSTSPNENEAASAAAMLQKFLVQHNLSMADLEMKGSTAKPQVGEQGHDLGKAAFKWKLDLAEGIAEHYYCYPIVNRKEKSVKFVGRPDNVEALQMLYGWVIEQIRTIARDERRKHFDTTGEHIDPLRWQLGFGEGAVERLIVRLKEMKARTEEDMSRNEYGDVTALAIHHQSEVSDFLERQYGYRTDGKRTAREQEREDRWDKYIAEREEADRKKEAMRAECDKNGDMAPFYAEYPDEHPDAVAKRKAELDKWRREDDRKDRERERRRNASGYYERRDSQQQARWDREDRINNDPQKVAARASGRKNADKINLEPFIGDGGGKTKGAIG